MVRRIILENNSPVDARPVFRLLVDDELIADALTPFQAHVLIGEILDRITIPRNSSPD